MPKTQTSSYASKPHRTSRQQDGEADQPRGQPVPMGNIGTAILRWIYKYREIYIHKLYIKKFSEKNIKINMWLAPRT